MPSNKNSSKEHKQGTERGDESSRDNKKEKEKEHKHNKEEQRQNNGEHSNSNEKKDNTKENNEKNEGKRTTMDVLKKELDKIEEKLDEEKSKLKPTPRQEYLPYVFNGLRPYCDTHTQRYILELPEDVHHGYVNRNTAIGLCDPWVAHHMDVDLLPKNPSSPRSPPTNKKNKKDEERPPREGNSHVPNFSNIKEPKELMNRPVYFNEIPKIREELKKTYSSQAEGKQEAEYKRTKQDFYRMELDRMEDYHPSSRPMMRKTYFAYLQNNPGSKRAVKECVGEIDAKEKEKEKERKKQEEEKEKEREHERSKDDDRRSNGSRHSVASRH